VRRLSHNRDAGSWCRARPTAEPPLLLRLRSAPMLQQWQPMWPFTAPWCEWRADPRPSPSRRPTSAHPRRGQVHQDDADHCGAPGLPALHQEVRQVRQAGRHWREWAHPSGLEGQVFGWLVGWWVGGWVGCSSPKCGEERSGNGGSPGMAAAAPCCPDSALAVVPLPPGRSGLRVGAASSAHAQDTAAAAAAAAAPVGARSVASAQRLRVLQHADGDTLPRQQEPHTERSQQQLWGGLRTFCARDISSTHHSSRPLPVGCQRRYCWCWLEQFTTKDSAARRQQPLAAEHTCHCSRAQQGMAVVEAMVGWAQAGAFTFTRPPGSFLTLCTTCCLCRCSHHCCSPLRYEKRHTNISAHLSPAFRCREGDTVVIGQCR
jgi:hypothetical protein